MRVTINISVSKSHWGDDKIVYKELQIETESGKDTLEVCGHIGGAIQAAVVSAINERMEIEEEDEQDNIS